MEVAHNFSAPYFDKVLNRKYYPGKYVLMLFMNNSQRILPSAQGLVAPQPPSARLNQARCYLVRLFYQEGEPTRKILNVILLHD